MKVVTDTPDRFEAVETPWLMAILSGLFIVVFSIAGAGALASGEPAGAGLFLGTLLGVTCLLIFARHTPVVLDRTAGTMEIRRRSVLSRSHLRYSLAEVARADLQYSGGTGRKSWRIAIHIPEGDGAGWHPLTPDYANVRGRRRTVKAMNAWLEAARSAPAPEPADAPPEPGTARTPVR